MNIDQELKAVERFEDRFGEAESAKRVCDFMVSYIAGMQRPLPEFAAQGLCVAINYKQGSASDDELESARRSISDFLRERGAQMDYSTPELCIVHAVEVALKSYQSPPWGGGATEAIILFLDMPDDFECNHELAKRLVEEHFSL
jgi:hypothetical protein